MNPTQFLPVLIVLGITLHSSFSQEPFSYGPEDIPEQDIPEGLTAEEYIEQIHQEWHFPMKLTLRVVDEDRDPVQGASANVGLDSRLHADGHNNYKGKTDANGLFTVEGRGAGSSEVSVEKDGYYISRPEIQWSGELNNDRELMKEVGYRPWNPTIDVILKKIGNPIPMLVRRAWGGSKSWLIPEPDQIGKDLGWDLVKGDWVAPAGTGKVGDLIVTFGLSRTDDQNHSSSMKIRMGNPDDGFIVLQELKGEESLLSFPRTAPVEGYGVANLEFTWKYDGGTPSRLPVAMPKGYLFRLRTTKDEKGEIVSAIYGKITKPFDFQASSTGHGSLQTGFDYYLNLTPNDRNLEYDQKNNLAPEADKDLRWPP